MVRFFGPSAKNRAKINIPPVAVLGLGRFGSSLAKELTAHGVEVLGVDADARLVEQCKSELTDAAVADTTDMDALQQLGIGDFDRVVLGIGSSLESSILTASALLELGVPDVWAKADSKAHARILTQIGVHHVVRPERDTGRRVAHLLGGRFQDFAEFDEDFGMIKMHPPAFLQGGPVDNEALSSRAGVRVVEARVNGDWQPITSDTRLSSEDLIIVAGELSALEKFG
ncbi:potassium channel family protein [Corynebacterium sp. HMSC28B08]|uniref:potassium channel family protein n=1 Tax=Corynebacterium auriscanis TaxID=99807 RepID=UPI0008A3CDD0|nr:potassium transporter [Corynebacterium sp. HMSC28B08]